MSLETEELHTAMLDQGGQKLMINAIWVWHKGQLDKNKIKLANIMEVALWWSGQLSQLFPRGRLVWGGQLRVFFISHGNLSQRLCLFCWLLWKAKRKVFVVVCGPHYASQRCVVMARVQANAPCVGCARHEILLITAEYDCGGSVWSHQTQTMVPWWCHQLTRQSPTHQRPSMEREQGVRPERRQLKTERPVNSWKQVRPGGGPVVKNNYHARPVAYRENI